MAYTGYQTVYKKYIHIFTVHMGAQRQLRKYWMTKLYRRWPNCRHGNRHCYYKKKENSLGQLHDEHSFRCSSLSQCRAQLMHQASQQGPGEREKCRQWNTDGNQSRLLRRWADSSIAIDLTTRMRMCTLRHLGYSNWIVAVKNHYTPTTLFVTAS